MRRPVIAVDVDLTVVRSDYHWWEWLEKHSNRGLRFEQLKNYYDYTPFYLESLQRVGLHPMDFWRADDVYDNMLPIGTAPNVLDRLSGKFDIVFVSVLKGNHHKSKFNFLKRHFPFLGGFIATKEKGYVAADIVIDDRNKYLNQFHDEVLKVKFLTACEQDEKLRQLPDLISNDWVDIGNFIEDCV